MSFSEDLSHLEAYLLDKYGVNVVFGRDELDAYYCDAECIGISTKHSKEIQLFCLLHEAGHHIYRLENNITGKSFDPKKSFKTISARVDVITEEIHAWEYGFRLAKQIGIEINAKKWERYSKKQVYDYVKWGVNGG
tara:strand:- start:1532 stop:1939 length:408 start_codon:yes stop_codon:yes gene_type:complete